MTDDHLMFAPAKRRRGLSLLEFVGCFTAMAGGVVLGSMYLGVDVQGLLFSTVTQVQRMTGVAEAKPASDAAAGPVATATTTPTATPTATAPETPAAGQPQTGEHGPGSAAPLPAAPVTAPSPPAAAAVVPPTELKDILALTDEQRAALTTAYWTALDSCMRQEFSHRTSAVNSTGDLELYRYLTVRHEGHRQAAETIAQLNRNGVDAHVTAYGEKALKWHESGAKLYSRARDLLTDAPTAQLSGPFAQSWQSAATQHQMEERLLAEKHHAVANYLSHQDE